MSQSSTPTRPGRGTYVPGIDTRRPEEKHNSVYFCGGLHMPLTPPHSANESRRPSLAFSAQSDASNSGPSSIAEYAQPATPINHMHQSGDDFAHHWSDGTDMQLSMSASMNDGCTVGQIQPMFSAAYPSESIYGPAMVDTAPHYSPMDAFNVHADLSPMRGNGWQHTIQSPTTFDMHAPGLKSTLYQSDQIGQIFGGNDTSPGSSMYAQPSSMHAGLQLPNFAHYIAAPVTSSVYQTPHTVVPSQLSPHDDCAMEQYSDFVKDERLAQDDFAHSFNSSSSWVTVDHRRPDEEYDTYSSDSEFVMVKDEHNHEHAGRLRRDRTARGTSSSGQKFNVTRRRSARRARKARGEEAHFRIGTIHVREAGFVRDKDGICISTTPTIQHMCDVVVDGKQCEKKFLRNEHLTRHKMSVHGEDRPFPCPLENCNKAIKRGDNANDHFFTHVKPLTAGLRKNHPCSWETLEIAILTSFPDDMAVSIMTKLQRKYIKKCPEAAAEAGIVGPYRILTPAGEIH